MTSPNRPTSDEPSLISNHRGLFVARCSEKELSATADCERRKRMNEMGMNESEKVTESGRRHFESELLCIDGGISAIYLGEKPDVNAHLTL
jgi:hypothetical protein